MWRMSELIPEDQTPREPSPEPFSQVDEDPLADTQPRKIQPAATKSTAQPSADDLAQTAAIAAAADEGLGGIENTLPPPTEPNEETPGSEPAPVSPAPAPAPAASSPRPVKKTGKKKPRKGRQGKDLDWLIIPLVGLAALVLIGLVSAFGGYSSGIGLRQNAEGTQMAQSAEQQFQLGLEDMAQGNYFRARQRFEYVIQLSPNYPGATEKLAEALLYLSATATPTLVPTPTITPTPDTRANEELFNQAQQASLNSEWDKAIEALLALRGKDATYRPVDIDGMLFLALRNRGRDRILKENNLESGIYDLTLASNFGPLDSEASGLMNWTQMYITGASFWGIDWAQAVDYFSQVAPQMPNLMDGSKMTATERLRLALFEYGNFLAQQGQPCKALKLYEQSFAIGADPQVQAAYDQVAKGCDGGGGGAEETPNSGGKKNKATQTP
jgi:tetratricopeptide (TPR) repeat protein